MRLRIIASAAIVVTAAGFLACNDSTAPSSTTFVATLSGANERPTANTSTASGTATYVLTGNTLAYTIAVTGLTNVPSGHHIHVGGSTVAGPVVVGFPAVATQSGVIATGTIDLSSTPSVTGGVISGDSLKVLLNNGNAYTNVHTAPTYPGGEIRGQIVRQ